MHSPRKSRPIQFISLLTAMILIMLLLVSCGGNAPSGGDKPDVEEKPDVTAPQDEEEDVNTQQQHLLLHRNHILLTFRQKAN